MRESTGFPISLLTLFIFNIVIYWRVTEPCFIHDLNCLLLGYVFSKFPFSRSNDMAVATPKVRVVKFSPSWKMCLSSLHKFQSKDQKSTKFLRNIVKNIVVVLKKFQVNCLSGLGFTSWRKKDQFHFSQKLSFFTKYISLIVFTLLFTRGVLFSQ